MVALFSHGHFLRVLGARWIGQPATAGAWLGLDTATVSCLGHEREQRVLRVWNCLITLLAASASLPQVASAHVAGVAERVAPGLGPHGEAVRLRADRDLRDVPVVVSIT